MAIGANTTSSSQGTNSVNIFVSMPSDFTFSSGAGAWATQLTLEDDGSFTGQYHEWDLKIPRKMPRVDLEKRTALNRAEYYYI